MGRLGQISGCRMRGSRWAASAPGGKKHISEGKLHDVNVLDLLVPEAGATYVMDRA